MGLVLAAKTSARSWARQMGLISLFIKVRGKLGSRTTSYEEGFAGPLLAAVRPGDCVWDVGANTGYYTALLSERAGASGVVCAFEPAPACFKRIEQRQLKNIKAFQIALGDRQSIMNLNIAADPLGDTHSLVDDSAASSGSIQVKVVAGDSLVDTSAVPVPNVLKIDVEGFEEEVLLGLQRTLKRPECRAVFCEVHFGTLEKRGKRQAPVRIEAQLDQCGFKTKWLDSSHLGATRPE